MPVRMRDGLLSAGPNLTHFPSGIICPKVNFDWNTSWLPTRNSDEIEVAKSFEISVIE